MDEKLFSDSRWIEPPIYEVVGHSEVTEEQKAKAEAMRMRFKTRTAAAQVKDATNRASTPTKELTHA